MSKCGTKASLWVVVGWLLLLAATPRALAKPEPDPSGAEADARAEEDDNGPAGRGSPAARAAFEAGRLAYDHGRFPEAVSQFELAYELSHHPKLLFNLARAAESDEQNERASAAYSAYLRALPDADNRDFVEARLKRLRGADDGSDAHGATSVPTPRETAALDVAALESAPGPEAPRDDGSAARPFYKRAWFWTVVGVAVAGTVTAAVVVNQNNTHEPISYDLSVRTLRVQE